MSVDFSIEQLENDFWQKPSEDSSRIAIKCYELRKKPISELTTEDLRLLIGQGIGLDFLIPLAIEILKLNPFIEGDYYEGDLLKNVLKCNGSFWQKNKNLWFELNQIVEKNIDKWKKFDTTDEIKEEILSAFDYFRMQG